MRQLRRVYNEGASSTDRFVNDDSLILKRCKRFSIKATPSLPTEWFRSFGPSAVPSLASGLRVEKRSQTSDPACQSFVVDCRESLHNPLASVPVKAAKTAGLRVLKQVLCQLQCRSGSMRLFCFETWPCKRSCEARCKSHMSSHCRRIRTRLMTVTLKLLIRETSTTVAERRQRP